MSDARLCIALVDDEMPVRLALGRLLRLADYEVTEFASGKAFLAWLHTGHPDLVILDVHMPGLSGLDVQTRLRLAQPTLSTMFITASDDPALDRAVSEAGSLRLLRKPFSSDMLLGAVSAALRDRSP